MKCSIKLHFTRFMRGSKSFCQGVGGPGSSDRKKALTTFLLVLNLIYSFTEGLQWCILRKTINFQRSRESSKFSSGSTFFHGIIETYSTCDFPRGCPDPYPPLDPCMRVHTEYVVLINVLNIPPYSCMGKSIRTQKNVYVKASLPLNCNLFYLLPTVC